MKAHALLLFATFVGVSTVSAFGQTDPCDTSNKLVCQLPITSSILNADGSDTLKNQEKSTGKSINASFATQLAQLPIPSATVGVVTLRVQGSQFGKPFDNLGPILTDRPDTVGKGHLFAGFSYQHFNFNDIDGLKLNNLNVAYTTPATAANGDQQVYYGSVTSDISFKLDQYVALFTYGATNKTDITVVVPINSVTLGVKASNFLTYLYDVTTKQYSSLGYPAGTVIKSSGSASGIGDITINAKQLIYGAEGSRAAVAVGGSLRIPTGDDQNYLGSGAWGGNIYGLVSYRARLSPHMKLAYQWNGGSNLVTGDSLPGGLLYDAGADFKVSRPLTIAADILGSQFVNSPSLSNQTITLSPTPAASTSIPSTLKGVVSGANTYTTSNLSAGVKWSPLPHFLLYGSVLLPINNVGLRSDPVPLFGIAYNLRIHR